MEPAATQLALLTDNHINKMTGADLARRAVELNTGLEQHFNLAALHGCATVQHAVALGQVFEVAFRKFEGEFAEWLKSAVGNDAEDKPRVSETTALRYRTMWRKRDLIFPPDGSAPLCRTLTEAYIKVGLIPAPVPGEDQQPAGAKVFRLTYHHSTTPPEEWPAADRQAYLDLTAPIVEMRAKIEALAA